MATPSEQYQLMQELARLAGVDLAALWELALVEDDPFAFVLDLYPEIAAQYATIAAEMSAVWYEEQAPELDFTATPAALPALAVYRENAAWALGSGSGLEDREAALAKLTGALQKGVWDADRETMTQNAESEGGARWVREAGPSSCPFCKMLATRAVTSGTYYSSRSAAETVVGRGKEMSLSDRRARARGETRSSGRFIAKGRRPRGSRALGKSYHDNCVPAGTLVSGPAADSAYRRLYEGEAVVIHTASGQKLTITPNHPVLTDQGWVPAGLLERGGNVVRSLTREIGPCAVPDENQKPAPIEDVWGSLAMDSLACVPGAAEDFHGDGLHSEVEVVGANSLLRRESNSAVLEPLGKFVFPRALRGSGRIYLAGDGKFASLIPGARTTSGRFVGGSGEGLSLVGREAGHSDESSFGMASGFDAVELEVSANCGARHFESLGDLEFGKFLDDVEVTERSGIDVDAVATRFDPSQFEFSAEGRLAYAELGRRLVGRLSGKVELDSIVQLDRISFSGHVYNLETREGWYSADNIIVSNCDCRVVAVRPGREYDPPEHVLRFEQEYIEASRAAPGTGAGNVKDIMAAWRQLENK